MADAQIYCSGTTTKAEADHHRHRQTDTRPARHQTSRRSNTHAYAKTQSLCFKRQGNGENDGKRQGETGHETKPKPGRQNNQDSTYTEGKADAQTNAH